jgi:hypothetical protein
MQISSSTISIAPADRKNRHEKPIKVCNSPNLTPIKPLPFSPSQFLNSPTLNLNFDENIPASTPVRRTDAVKVKFLFFHISPFFR